MIVTPAAILATEFYKEAYDWFTDPALGEAWPLSVNVLPDDADSPADAAALFDTSGDLYGRLLDTGEVLERFGIQLRVRAYTPNEGWAKIRVVSKAVSTWLNKPITVGEESFVLNSVTQTSTIVALGSERDAKKREHFTVNWLLFLTEL